MHEAAAGPWLAASADPLGLRILMDPVSILLLFRGLDTVFMHFDLNSPSVRRMQQQRLDGWSRIHGIPGEGTAEETDHERDRFSGYNEMRRRLTPVYEARMRGSISEHNGNNEYVRSGDPKLRGGGFSRAKKNTRQR
jgi:hypothetical protein